jgi:hypothetical protein
MYAEHLLAPLAKVVLLVGAVAAAIAGGVLGGQGAGGALEGGTAWITERCGGVDMTRTATLDAAWALDVPPGFFGAGVHLDVDFQERESAGTLRSLDALALFVATVPLPDDVRATVDAQMEAILAARAALSAAGAPIETLEQRLAALVDCLDELEATLVGVLGVAPSPRGADAILAATLLIRASGDFVDGLRYLAGRVRLYGRGALRTECAAILWHAADAACDGEMSRASVALTELRAALVETSPAAFQRSRLDAALSKVDSLLGDGPRRGGSVALGASGGASAASLFGVPTDWTARVTREMGTVPTARSTEMAWTASSELDIWEAQIEAVVEARTVGHDDAAARDGDVVDTSAEVTAEFTVGGADAEADAEADASIGVRVELERYAFEFDREIPASNVAAAERGVSNLLAAVARLGLPGAVAGRLVAPLNRARLALWEGRTADAVTALGQFRDQVWKEAFGGALGEGAAADLAAATEDLLPRREETTWTVPASIAGVLGEWSGTIDAEWVRRAAPSDSLIERTDSVVSVRAKREVEGAALSVDAQARRVDYPHDAAKGYCQSQFAGRVSDDGDGPLEVELGAEWTATLYALDARKDKRVADLSLDVAFAEEPWELTLSVSESRVEYPNDPGRDERMGAWEIGVDAAFVGGTLGVAWTSEWPLTAPGRETEEIFRVEFDASGAEAIDVHLAAEAVGTKRAEEGGACHWTLRWEVGVDVDF